MIDTKQEMHDGKFCTVFIKNKHLHNTLTLALAPVDNICHYRSNILPICGAAEVGQDEKRDRFR